MDGIELEAHDPPEGIVGFAHADLGIRENRIRPEPGLEDPGVHREQVHIGGEPGVAPGGEGNPADQAVVKIAGIQEGSQAGIDQHHLGSSKARMQAENRRWDCFFNSRNRRASSSVEPGGNRGNKIRSPSPLRSIASQVRRASSGVGAGR